MVHDDGDVELHQEITSDKLIVHPSDDYLEP